MNDYDVHFVGIHGDHAAPPVFAESAVLIHPTSG